MSQEKKSENAQKWLEIARREERLRDFDYSKFKIMGRLGEGSYGEVVKAERSNGDINLTFALKYLKEPDNQPKNQEFIREVCIINEVYYLSLVYYLNDFFKILA